MDQETADKSAHPVPLLSFLGAAFEEQGRPQDLTFRGQQPRFVTALHARYAGTFVTAVPHMPTPDLHRGRGPASPSSSKTNKKVRKSDILKPIGTPREAPPDVFFVSAVSSGTTVFFNCLRSGACGRSSVSAPSKESLEKGSVAADSEGAPYLLAKIVLNVQRPAGGPVSHFVSSVAISAVDYGVPPGESLTVCTSRLAVSSLIGLSTGEILLCNVLKGTVVNRHTSHLPAGALTGSSEACSSHLVTAVALCPRDPGLYCGTFTCADAFPSFLALFSAGQMRSKTPSSSSTRPAKESSSSFFSRLGASLTGSSESYEGPGTVLSRLILCPDDSFVLWPVDCPPPPAVGCGFKDTAGNAVSASLRCVAFSPGDDISGGGSGYNPSQPAHWNLRVAVGTDNGTVLVIRLDGTVLFSARTVFGGVIALDWKQPGFLVFAGEDDTVSVADSVTGTVLLRCAGHKSWISCVQTIPHASLRTYPGAAATPFPLDDAPYPPFSVVSVGHDGMLCVFDGPEPPANVASPTSPAHTLPLTTFAPPAQATRGVPLVLTHLSFAQPLISHLISAMPLIGVCSDGKTIVTVDATGFARAWTRRM